MMTSTLKSRLDSGETVVGTFQLIGSPVISEIIGQAGLDFVVLDQEHGSLTAETCHGLVASASVGGAHSVIRVRENSGPEIQRALDLGPDAVEIPQIENARAAKEAAAAARFDPIGERGLSPYVRAGEYMGGDEYTSRQNEEVAVIGHIEGEAGVENLDEIMAVEGIDVLFLGPYDLSQSLGIPGQVHDDRVVDRMEEVCERAADEGLVVGAYADDPAMANRWIETGVQYVAIMVDAPLFHQRIAELVAGVDNTDRSSTHPRNRE